MALSWSFSKFLPCWVFLWLRNGNSCNRLVCLYVQNIENMSVVFQILNPFVPIQKAPAWLVTSCFVADQRFLWPFSTLWLLLSLVSNLFFFFSSQISKQWKNSYKTPEQEFAVTGSWEKPETRCYYWKEYFQNALVPDLRNPFCPETSLQHVSSTWWSHGSQNVSVHMLEYDPESCPLLVRIPCYCFHCSAFFYAHLHHHLFISSQVNLRQTAVCLITALRKL